jgi:hypothetical protein
MTGSLAGFTVSSYSDGKISDPFTQVPDVYIFRHGLLECYCTAANRSIDGFPEVGPIAYINTHDPRVLQNDYTLSQLRTRIVPSRYRRYKCTFPSPRSRTYRIHQYGDLRRERTLISAISAGDYARSQLGQRIVPWPSSSSIESPSSDMVAGWSSVGKRM